MLFASLASPSQQKEFKCNYGKHWDDQFTCKLDYEELTERTRGISFKGADEHKERTMRLWIEKSKIEFISSKIFVEFANLEGLKLYMCNIFTLKKRILSQIEPVIYLDLELNKIELIEEGSLDNLENLEFLSLAANSIEEIPTDLFYYNTLLRDLDLSDNRIKDLDRKVFSRLLNLQHLQMWKNHLMTLPPDIFQNNINLQTLSLTDNVIFMLHPDIFDNLHELEFLGLDDNVCISQVFKTKEQVKNAKNELQKCASKCKNNPKCFHFIGDEL